MDGNKDGLEVDISANIYSLLKNGHYNEVLKLIKQNVTKNYLKENSLDIVPVVIRILDEEFCNEDIERCVEEILVATSKVAKTKEVILALLEEIEVYQSNKQFRVIIKPLQIILLRESSKNSKFKIFSWVFDTLYSYVCKLPIPSEYTLEEEEKKLLDCDDNVMELTESLALLAELYESIFKELLSGNLLWPNVNSKEYFAFYILRFFDKPLTYLNIYQSLNDMENKKPVSKLYRICLKFFNMILSLLKNPFKLLGYVKPKYLGEFNNMTCASKTKFSGDNLEDFDKDETHVQISQLALGTFFYCLFGQSMGTSFLPCVYSVSYLYLSCLPCCVHLILQKEALLIHKGLILLKSNLDSIQQNILPVSSLDAPNHYEAMQSLVKVMTLCDDKECRIIAVTCFKSLLWKFEGIGCLKLFTTIFKSVNHSGIQSVVIHELKEFIYKNLTKDISHPNIQDKNNLGNKLTVLFKLIFKLPDGEKTDLLDWSDKIMGSLNLALFLCIRDSANATGFWNFKQDLIVCFLQPLEDGLRLSKGHYELKLKELEECNIKASSKIKFSVNAGESLLPNLPPEQEKEVILSALNWMDMMQSVLMRVNKLI